MESACDQCSHRLGDCGDMSGFSVLAVADEVGGRRPKKQWREEENVSWHLSPQV